MNTYRLIEQLKHYNLTYLIPERLTICFDDDLEDDIFDPSQDEYYDNYDYHDAELEYILGNGKTENEYGYNDTSLFGDIEDLMQMFDSDYMSPEEFLSMNIWDLFGLTKNQFDLIDWRRITSNEFEAFYETFVNEPQSMPVEKRILYSMAEAVTHYRNLTIYHNDEYSAETILRYAERIIDTHEFGKARHLISLLSDYMRFYADALEMNARRLQNGEPTHRYVFLPKPTHLKDLHDKASRDYAFMNAERAVQSKERFDKAFQDAVHSPDYLSMLYKDENYIMRPVTCQADLDKEARYLNHCVDTYGCFIASGKSYIYLIRRADKPDTPFYTAEIQPSESYKKKPVLNQLYTFYDSTEKTKEFRDFILRWAKDKRININCKV